MQYSKPKSIERRSAMKKIRKKKSAFTRKGYNDRSKPCPFGICKGKIEPTRNANVGKCNRCGKKISWSHIAEHC